jgi:Domain of unknown function (DUF4410)
MRSMLLNRVYILLALAVAACAGASATQEYQAAPTIGARPTQIVVYPFAVEASEVTLNQSIIQRAYRNLSGENQGAQQLQVARDTAHNVCLQVASGLAKKGYTSVCQERGVPISGDNVLIVDGEFTDINEGNRLRRTIIGFGAGASTLDTSVHVYQRSGGAPQQVLAFNTHADSGKMPGAVVMGPAGVAAGGSAAAVVGANAAVGGAKGITSSTGFLVDKTTAQILDSLTQYFVQHGWTT